MSTRTKRIVLAIATLAIAVVFALLLLPSLMGRPRPEKLVPIFAGKELSLFQSDFDEFKRTHDGRSPTSVAELLADGKYLKGVVEPYRTLTLNRLEYPLT